jgi:hypothetical protein
MLSFMSEIRSSDQSSGESEESARNSPGPTTGQAPTNQGNPDRRKRRGPPPNPLYHPLFLPVLLVAFAIWFGWDGFLTSDPDMQKHQGFNRIMFYIMVPLCVWMVPRGIREFREDQAAADGKQPTGNAD